MNTKKTARTWVELAAALGCTVKTFERWRDKYPREWPQPTNGLHDVEKWRVFAFERGLRPSQAWESPMLKPSHPTKHRGTSSTGGTLPVLSCDWEYRREVLFELMEIVHAGYAGGELTIEQYFKAGEATAREIVALGNAWEAGIDADGFLKNWRAIFAEAAWRKNEENKVAARARG